MDIFKEIAGCKIESILESHDYFQMYLNPNDLNTTSKIENKATGKADVINVYSQYQYDGGPISSIEGNKIKSILDLEDRLVFIFGNDTKLSISLRDEDYNCPEAVGIYWKGEIIIIN